MREITKKTMEYMAEKDDVVFIGQNLLEPKHQMTDDFVDINPSKIIEFPVAEEMQMGVSIGLALEGKVVVSVYPRFDFLILATNQIVNHLDKLNHLYRSGCPGRVIIRTSVGGRTPLDAGPQHTQDHTGAFKLMCPQLNIKKVDKSNLESYKNGYRAAYLLSKNSIIIE